MHLQIITYLRVARRVIPRIALYPPPPTHTHTEALFLIDARTPIVGSSEGERFFVRLTFLLSDSIFFAYGVPSLI